MSVAHKFLPHYTYDDYQHWEGQWELIDGIPYAMSPAPIPKHQWIASLLAAKFIEAIMKSRCSCKVYQPIDYKLADDTIFNPDLSVVCRPITKKFLDFAPGLVVEILSDATRMKDRNVKYPKYEAAGIHYYLMVDADAELIEIYRLIDGAYTRQTVDQNQPFTFDLDDCQFDIVFDSIWE